MTDIVPWFKVKNNTWYFYDEPNSESKLLRFVINLYFFPYTYHKTVTVLIYKNDQITLTEMDNILKNHPVIVFDPENRKWIGPSCGLLAIAFRYPIGLNSPLDYSAIITSPGFIPSRRQSTCSDSSQVSSSSESNQQSTVKSKVRLYRTQIPECYMATIRSHENTPTSNCLPQLSNCFQRRATFIHDTRRLSDAHGSRTPSPPITLTRQMPPLPATPRSLSGISTFRRFVPTPMQATDQRNPLQDTSCVPVTPRLT